MGQFFSKWTPWEPLSSRDSSEITLAIPTFHLINLPSPVKVSISARTSCLASEVFAWTIKLKQFVFLVAFPIVLSYCECCSSF